MKGQILPFNEPIYVTQPLLPPLEVFVDKIRVIWGSHQLTNNGPLHKQLEDALLKALMVPSISLFNNGTIALIVACQSMRLSGEVITTPFTFAATPHVLSWNNIRPIFCDIEQNSMNIDAAKIESMITPQTTGILAVHVFGTPCNVSAIQEVADHYGLRIIYDAAHAFGVEIDNKGIGTFGDITMFSFHATKLFHTAEGGALTFNDKNLKSRIDLLKNFGIKNEELVVMPGINGKMNELQAAFGLVLLDLISEEKRKRKIIYNTYCKYLEGVEGLTLQRCDIPGVEPSYQYLIIRIDEMLFGKTRDYVYNELRKYNIFARKYFHPLCSDFACYRNIYSSNHAMLPNAVKVSDEVLSLPFYGELKYNDVEKICSIIINTKNQRF